MFNLLFFFFLGGEGGGGVGGRRILRSLYDDSSKPRLLGFNGERADEQEFREAKCMCMHCMF